MKVAGIILIGLQLFVLLGGGLPSASGGAGYSLGFYLGYFLPGIIGVILLIKGSKKNNQKNNKEQDNFEKLVQESGLSAFEYVKSQLSPTVREFCENNSCNIPKMTVYLDQLKASGLISERDADILLHGYKTAAERVRAE